MGKPTVLVVEDDPDIRDLLVVVLADEGYCPITALGMAVVARAAEAPPAAIPIIAMTALTPQSVPPALQYDAWLGKPFNLTDLFRALATVIAPPRPVVTDERDAS